MYYQTLSFLTLLRDQAHVSQQGADTHILIFLLKTVTAFLQNPTMLKCTGSFPIHYSRLKLHSHRLLLLHAWGIKILLLNKTSILHVFHISSIEFVMANTVHFSKVLQNYPKLELLKTTFFLPTPPI